MKAVKIIFKVVFVIVALVVAAVLASPLWFGPVAKTAANAAAPGIVKTDFRLGRLSLNPYTARFELGELNLGNPKGYSVNEAVRVGEIVFDAETLSLVTDVIHIEEITVRDLFVSVVSGGENDVLNFKQIQYNIAGGKEKYEAAQSEKEAKSASVQGRQTPDGESGAEKPSKKIIIDRLEISGLTLQLSILPIRIPSVVLTDIGRKSGGATLDEAWQQILDGIMKAAGVTGDQLKALGVLSGDAVKTANETLTKGTAQATAVVSGATKQVSAVTEKATAVTGKATSAINATVGAATGATSGTVNAATGAVKGSVKTVDESVKAVGDGAKKALDSLKGLW